MRILIVGGGKTGSYLAHMLHENHEIALIEQQPERAERVRAMVPDATIIVGDACEPDVLEQANIRGVDVVAAMTGDDEDNLVVAMLAKHYGAKTVYGRVNHPRNEWLFDKEWGVDVPVSAPQIAYGLIEKDLGLGDLISLLKLKAEGVYLEEITLPASATKIGKHLRDVGLPSNVTVVAILAAEGYVQAPHGDTLLVGGDQLLLLVSGSLEESTIREAFGISGDEATDGEDSADPPVEAES